MVNLDILSDQGTVHSERTVIDHEYFADSESPEICDVEDMPSWFKLDSADLNKYDIAELNYTGCP